MTIDNNCDEALVFGEVEIPVAVRGTVDIQQKPDDLFAFIESASIFLTMSLNLTN